MTEVTKGLVGCLDKPKLTKWLMHAEPSQANCMDHYYDSAWLRCRGLFALGERVFGWTALMDAKDCVWCLYWTTCVTKLNFMVRLPT